MNEVGIGILKDVCFYRLSFFMDELIYQFLIFSRYAHFRFDRSIRNTSCFRSLASDSITFARSLQKYLFYTNENSHKKC